jgi:hypothetical protein
VSLADRKNQMDAWVRQAQNSSIATQPGAHHETTLRAQGDRWSVTVRGIPTIKTIGSGFLAIEVGYRIK